MFKPNIEFKTLVETGSMGHEELAPYFGHGAPLSKKELAYARDLAMKKHPEIRSQIRCKQSTGLRLMSQVETSQYWKKGVHQAFGNLGTRIGRFEETPTDQMKADDRNRHDRQRSCLLTLRLEAKEQQKKLLKAGE